MKLWERWKQKWGIETDRRMLWIFVIFAITGSTTVWVRKGIYQLFGIQIANATLEWVVKLLLIYFVYQILLITIGSVLGEHRFFRWFLIKMNSRFLPKSITKYEQRKDT